MTNTLAWKPGDATKLAAFHRQYAPPVEAPFAYDAPTQPELAAHDCDTEALLNDLREYIERDALQQRQNDAVLHPVAVGTPVMFRGAFAFVVERNPNDDTRYELRWFDAHYHVFRQKWVNRENFEVVATVAAQ